MYIVALESNVTWVVPSGSMPLTFGATDVPLGADHAARLGRGGQSPPRVRSAMAMSDSGLW